MNPAKSALSDFVGKIWKRKDSPAAAKPPLRVFTKEELAMYKGHEGGRIYLAIAGNVYDVTTGRRHYGPGGGYSFFAGIDGSKGFVTGQFDEDGLVDDIAEFTTSQILSLESWMSFYEKDYKHIGVVEGSFYDKNGDELAMMHVYKNKLKTAKREQELLESDRELFPPCNSEWSKDRGGRIWCSNRSGGIKREWEGVPRLYYTAGSNKPRCACVRTTGPPSTDLNQKNHKNRGDLENPNLQVYPNCKPESISCPLPQNN